MKLPWWRVIAGFGVLGGLVAVLISLAPVYLDDYRLRGYMKTLVQQTASDEELRAQVLARAHQLDLPVKGSEITISHPDGRQKLEAKYVVEMNLALYQVDLHFHPHAER